MIVLKLKLIYQINTDQIKVIFTGAENVVQIVHF